VSHLREGDIVPECRCGAGYFYALAGERSREKCKELNTIFLMEVFVMACREVCVLLKAA
jgi:hypothetical protein